MAMTCLVSIHAAEVEHVDRCNAEACSVAEHWRTVDLDALLAPYRLTGLPRQLRRRLR